MKRTILLVIGSVLLYMIGCEDTPTTSADKPETETP